MTGKNYKNVPNSDWPGNHTAYDEASLLFKNKT